MQQIIAKFICIHFLQWYAADISQQMDAYELVYVSKQTSVSEDWYMDDKCVLDRLIINSSVQ